MRLLPILWKETPTPDDWVRLSAARAAIGHSDLIKPVQALPGSPGPVLAIGTYPTWLTPWAYVESTENAERLQKALSACLNREEVGSYEMLLSSWMGVDVKFLGEEEYDGGVQFT